MKLTSSKESSTPDFWKFYIQNRAEIDSIVNSQLRKHVANEPDNHDDYRQEVLMRLNRLNVLAQYDETKSQLNTYLTNKISGYVCHIRATIHHKPKWIPYPSEEEKAGKTHRFKKVSVEEIFKLRSNLSEDNLAFRDTVAYLKRNLDTPHYEILVLISQGYNNSEIMRTKEISLSTLRAALVRMHMLLKRSA